MVRFDIRDLAGLVVVLPQHSRWLIGTAAVLVLIVDCGGIVMRAVKRSYIPGQKAAVEFLLANTTPSDRISGTAGLVYALHFDGRLREDKYLGLRGGVIPNAVVIDPDMWGPRYKAWEHEYPDDLKRVNERLRTTGWLMTGMAIRSTCGSLRIVERQAHRGGRTADISQSPLTR